MKKGILLMLAMFMMVSITEANNGKPKFKKEGYNYFRTVKPVTFFENGVKFFVYPNGEFDFNSHFRNSSEAYYFKGRRTTNLGRERGVRILKDRFGQIRRIGNITVDYTRSGKVAQIGSVSMDYFKGKLKRVGNMKIIYHPHKGVKYIGKVKSTNHRYYGWDEWEYGYDHNFFYQDDFKDRYDRYDEDDNYFYYKSKVNNKNDKGKLIKRKKRK